MRQGTKRAAVIAIMTENSDKPMDKVIQIMLDKVGFNGGVREARMYYGNMLRANLAPGEFVHQKRGRKPKDGVEPKPKKVVDRVTPVKSDDEIAAIQAANMERIRKIAAKMGKTSAVVEVEDDHELREQFRHESDHPEYVTPAEARHIID